MTTFAEAANLIKAKTGIMPHSMTQVRAMLNSSPDKGIGLGIIFADKGILVTPEGINPYDSESKTINYEALNANMDKVQELADLVYLSQNTGVNTNTLNAVYTDLGIDNSTGFGFTDANKILSAAGYNVGEQTTFYGNNTANDVGAKLLYDKWQTSLDADLEDGEIIENNNVANSIFLAEELAKQEVNPASTNALLRTDYNKATVPASNNTIGLNTDNRINILEWGKKEEEEKIKTPTGMGSNLINITPPSQPASYNPYANTGGSQVTGGQSTGYITQPVYTPPTVTQTGNTTETTIPTYEGKLATQGQNFATRATSPAQTNLMQPQTIAEKTAAGLMTPGSIKQKLFRNLQGMSMYVLGTVNNQGVWIAQQPIPAGYTEVKEQQGIAVAEGGYIGGYAPGGMSEARPFLRTDEPTTEILSYEDWAKSQGFSQALIDRQEGGQANLYNDYVAKEKKLADEKAYQNSLVDINTQTNVNQPQTIDPAQINQATDNLLAQSIVAPAGAVAAPPVAYVDPNAGDTVLASTTGQAVPVAPVVTDLAQVSDVTTAAMPTQTGANQAALNKAYKDMQTLMTGTDAVSGATLDAPSKTITGQTKTDTAISDLDAAGITSAQTVQSTPTRTLQTGEVIPGSTVDQTRVGQTFGTGEVQAASIQGELATLMNQFDDGKTPAWAAGSMRRAMSMLSSRGLGASGLAGQAVIQAAMEAALPIAQIDTANKQQMALLKAEQRAKFLQIEFDQEFQAKVTNAARVSEIANMNFNAQQQVALENAKMAQTVDLNNLSNKQAVIMANAAQLSQLELTGLNNLQQAQVQNAQNFLQIDMAELSNAQQAEMFKAQSLANTLLSDTAAANATAQFNASSQNQTDQFFANLSSQISQYNSAQLNAMKQYNANETNAMLKFNSEIQNQRELFNAQQYAVIAQANAKWRQDTTTLNTAAANQSNFEYAKQVNGLTNKTIDQIWQRERDLMGFTFTASESALERTLQMLLGDKSLEAAREAADATEGASKANLFARAFFGEFGLFGNN